MVQGLSTGEKKIRALSCFIGSENDKKIILCDRILGQIRDVRESVVNRLGDRIQQSINSAHLIAMADGCIYMIGMAYMTWFGWDIITYLRNRCR